MVFDSRLDLVLGKTPTSSYKYRYPVNEGAVVDYIMSEHQKSREKRNTERARLLAAAQEQQEEEDTQPAVNSGPWDAAIRDFDTRAPRDERLNAVAGHWALDLGRHTAADFGLACELDLGCDQACRFCLSSWDVDAPLDTRAQSVLLCTGRWRLQRRPLLCCLPPQRCFNAAHEIIISFEEGSETGDSDSALPLRWATLALGEIKGTIDLVALPGDERKRVLKFNINHRKWAFGLERPPGWQERCSMAGLDAQPHGEEVHDRTV